MLIVSDVFDDVRRVLGGSSDADTYSRLNDAVEILSAESDWDPTLGYVDVCVGCDRYVTLPREVGTVLAVTINGTPAQAHNWLFKFHLNAGGAVFKQIGYHWVDNLYVSTFLDPPPTALKLATTLETSADNGKKLRVFGYDVNGNWIRSLESGSYVDGFLVPTVYGTSTTNSSAPAIRRITRIHKDATAGVINLYTVDGTSLTKIGQYAPDETEPRYRRIQVSKPCSWVRVAFKRSSVKLATTTDLIPLHSKYAVVLMCKALKKFDEDRIEEGQAYRQMAIDLLRKKQQSVEVPSGPSIQVADGNLLADRSDRLE